MSGPERPGPGSRATGSRYFFYDNWDIPSEFEKTVPQVFPTTAPGNFTWLDDCGQVVMTTFYPYQWDLNYANPVVFNDMMENMLYLANRGIDVIRLDAVPYIWKQLGTSCRNLPQVHTLVRHDAHGLRDGLPRRAAAGRGGHGAGQGGALLRHAGKAGVPYALQRDHHGHHLAHPGHQRTCRFCATRWTPSCTLPRDFLFLNYLRCHDDIGWGLDYGWLKAAHFGTERGAPTRSTSTTGSPASGREATAGASSTTTIPVWGTPGCAAPPRPCAAWRPPTMSRTASSWSGPWAAT